MCGIIGYTGSMPAKNILLEGLAQLEYRGYDSAGIAICTDNNSIYLEKQTGPVENLKKACKLSLSEKTESNGTCGIGHTRWATHGKVTKTNTHPHQAGKVTMIHNGIIENYHDLIEKYDLKEQLISETDTEVAAAVLDHFYQEEQNELSAKKAPEQMAESAIWKLVSVLEGSYAFCILFQDLPNRVYCIRHTSPLVACDFENGMEKGSMVASDITALLQYNKKYFVVPEKHLMVLYNDHIKLMNQNQEIVEPDILEINWDVQAAQKNGYPHYMLKEIHEQPQALLNTITPRLTHGIPDFTEDGISDEFLKAFTNVHIVACGTAMHAGMAGKVLIESLARIPVTVHIASEFRCEEPLIDEHSLTIVVSQSGETIDTLESLRLAKSCHSKVLSIVNVKGSTIARESDCVMYTHAGPEIAVASTKAYTVQLAVFYLVACKLALVQQKITKEEAKQFMADFSKSIEAISQIVNQKDAIIQAIKPLINSDHAYYIGRGADYALAMEGSLKLKEISYIHAEAYAAGELKHGTIALIEENIPVIAFATQDSTYKKTISNIREVKARGASVILITKEGAEIPEGACDDHLTIPAEKDFFTSIPAAVILQLIAYYTADAKGCEIDKPRNLAKSVTVE